MFGDDLVPYLPEHIRPYANQLKQFPEGYEKWVYAASLPAETYQGDVFNKMSLASIDDDGAPYMLKSLVWWFQTLVTHSLNKVILFLWHLCSI